jgi:hypothetical protein
MGFWTFISTQNLGNILRQNNKIISNILFFWYIISFVNGPFNLMFIRVIIGLYPDM